MSDLCRCAGAPALILLGVSLFHGAGAWMLLGLGMAMMGQRRRGKKALPAGYSECPIR